MLPESRPSSRRWLLAVAVATAVFVCTRVRDRIPPWVELHRLLAQLGVPDGVRNLDGSLLTLAAAVVAARLAFGPGRASEGLGLRGSLGEGLAFGCAAGLPMILQALLARRGLRFDADVARGVLLAPFVEEVFFRAVLVGIPVRAGGAPFWPLAIGSALLFGSMHVPWDASFGPGHLGVLAATGAGGVWFAWIARSFGWNLWTTIVLHAVMNAAWMVTGVADDAAGGLWPNLGRAGTIALGCILTIRAARLRRQRR